jgi:hypothetical protein
MEELVRQWFKIWNEARFEELPISDTFKHTSPFGTIEGKEAYLNLVRNNTDKFLGYQFEIHDAIYEKSRACVRYQGYQKDDFSLDVSEWYYSKDGLIEQIVAYYHIGEIREDRKLS